MIINKYNNLSGIQTNYKATNNKVIACNKPDMVSFKSEFNAERAFNLLLKRLNDEDVRKLGSFVGDYLKSGGISSRLKYYGIKLYQGFWEMLGEKPLGEYRSSVLYEHGTILGEYLVNYLEDAHKDPALMTEALDLTAAIIKKGVKYNDVLDNMRMLGAYTDCAQKEGKQLADYGLTLYEDPETRVNMLVDPDGLELFQGADRLCQLCDNVAVPP